MSVATDTEAKSVVPPAPSYSGGAFATHVEDEYDYIVVGSGAGGGPVAANLAKDFSVLLLEAGGAEEPIEYRVPAFHGFSTEHNDLAWKFYVQHYKSPQRQQSDRLNFLQAEVVDGEPRDGIFYPRAGTLGGCTAHNAMILIYPHNSDWEYIADLTGDVSWAPSNMRRYFQRLERCEYAHEPWSELFNFARHGFKGWLPASPPDPTLLLRDLLLARLVAAAAQTCADTNVWDIDGAGWLGSALSSGNWRKSIPHDLMAWAESFFDPNDWGRVKHGLEGPAFTPLTIKNGVRRGTRERIRETLQVHPDKLTVKLNALVTRVVLDASKRATGVEFLDAPHLYRADPNHVSAGPPAEKRFVRARREVILAGGAFNTPQLLMLSGIGAGKELAKYGIEAKVDLPGVGKNLQDRYEIGIVHKMKRDFDILRDATFDPDVPDSDFNDWLNGYGLYASNGVVVAIGKKSSESHPDPDLVMFAIPSYFAGYRPGYSRRARREKNYFTWVILKAHTNNTAGRLQLKSADPCEPPSINFHYFDEGNDPHNDDLDSVVAAVEFVRKITARTASLFDEEIPGPHVRSRKDIEQFVKGGAWGHHACGTCKIGDDGDDMAVLDSRFRVRKTKGLRVVDASAFPKIPGVFILSAIYMIAEKASDVIREDAANQPVADARR